jgi:hypothetical protein
MKILGITQYIAEKKTSGMSFEQFVKEKKACVEKLAESDTNEFDATQLNKMTDENLYELYKEMLSTTNEAKKVKEDEKEVKIIVNNDDDDDEEEGDDDADKGEDEEDAEEDKKKAVKEGIDFMKVITDKPVKSYRLHVDIGNDKVGITPWYTSAVIGDVISDIVKANQEIIGGEMEFNGKITKLSKDQASSL